MQFLVNNSAKACGVLNPVVCVITNVKKSKGTEYDSTISKLMERIANIRQEILPSEEVQGYRELYEQIDRKITPAGEKLLLSCEQKGFPRYGNLVDAYNIVALETVSPFGMHDAKELLNSKCDLVFKRAEGNEEIIPAFKKEKVTIPKGDFTYGIVKEGKFIPFAWLGEQDVDSKNFQLKSKTKALLFTAIGNKYTSLERNKNLCKKVFEMIKVSCPEAKMTIYEPKFIN